MGRIQHCILLKTALCIEGIFHVWTKHLKMEKQPIDGRINQAEMRMNYGKPLHLEYCI